MISFLTGNRFITTSAIELRALQWRIYILLHFAWSHSFASHARSIRAWFFFSWSVALSEKNHDFGSLVCIYAQILPRIRAAAKELGYAIGIHGTMQRDFDLLTVPWTNESAEPIALVRKIRDEVGGYVIGDRTDERGHVSDHPTEQPHGRLSWNICWGGKPFIDISIMPRLQEFTMWQEAVIWKAERDELEQKGKDLCFAYGNALVEIHNLKKRIAELEAAVSE